MTLFVDGAETETRTGKTVFTFEIPLTGEHTIEAVSGEVRDRMTIRRVKERNPDYCFGGSGQVENWFDKIEIRPGFYSIKDKFGELLSNPGTAAVVGKIMDKAKSSRGDVAEGTRGNKALEQMMASMSFESLLKKAGANVIPPEQIKAINDMLQKHRKNS